MRYFHAQLQTTASHPRGKMTASLYLKARNKAQALRQAAAHIGEVDGANGLFYRVPKLEAVTEAAYLAGLPPEQQPDAEPVSVTPVATQICPPRSPLPPSGVGGAELEQVIACALWPGELEVATVPPVVQAWAAEKCASRDVDVMAWVLALRQVPELERLGSEFVFDVVRGCPCGDVVRSAAALDAYVMGEVRQERATMRRLRRVFWQVADVLSETVTGCAS